MSAHGQFCGKNEATSVVTFDLVTTLRNDKVKIEAIKPGAPTFFQSTTKAHNAEHCRRP